MELSDIEGPEPRSWGSGLYNVPGDLWYSVFLDKRPVYKRVAEWVNVLDWDMQSQWVLLILAIVFGCVSVYYVAVLEDKPKDVGKNFTRYEYDKKNGTGYFDPDT